jgi:hypothetical protein
MMRPIMGGMVRASTFTFVDGQSTFLRRGLLFIGIYRKHEETRTEE